MSNLPAFSCNTLARQSDRPAQTVEPTAQVDKATSQEVASSPKIFKIRRLGDKRTKRNGAIELKARVVLGSARRYVAV
uniref:Uncharacterized protein n=1 Tax=Agrobacterium vitis TaxID=373 RepID=A0A2Z2Q6M5_AGRVI|nr:hypothetical protein [Agrobacterium vitis]